MWWMAICRATSTRDHRSGGARHAELMPCVARRVSDAALLHLIKSWLVVAVEETDREGHVHRTTRNKDDHRGTPQGAPISPDHRSGGALANLSMRRFVLGGKTLARMIHEEPRKTRKLTEVEELPQVAVWHCVC